MKKTIKEQLNSLYGSTLFSTTDDKKETQTEEEWIWVEGYKGTDKDMKCRCYQYELGKQFDMPEDAKIEACEGGFHLCSILTDVYRYYDIGYGNRFFKVKALVRKKDYDDLQQTSAHSYIFALSMKDSKLAAKSIEFIEELTPDEILKSYVTGDWTDEDKQEAIQHGIDYVKNKHVALEQEKNVQTLVELGYSEPFASWLVSDDKYGVAFAVGSQPELSMDMKVLAIMKL